MRQKLVFMLLGIALVVGLIALPPAPVVEAGSSGQQIQFYNYSGSSAISYLQVSGKDQNNQGKTWSRTFSPSVQNYSLSGWWWQGRVSINWRMTDGRSGGCLIDVPKTLSRDWVQVGVARGTSCYYSY